MFNVCVLFVLAICSGTVTVGRAMRAAIPFGTDGDVCFKGQCVVVNYDALLRRYRHLFWTKDEFKEIQRQKSVNRDKYLNNQRHKKARTRGINDLPDDGDLCCPSSFTAFANSTMVNLNGDERLVLHMTTLEPPKYQFVTHGACVPGEGTCEGRCLVEPTTVSLLIYNFEQNRPEFDIFETPGYCSCKNVT